MKEEKPKKKKIFHEIYPIDITDLKDYEIKRLEDEYKKLLAKK